MANTKKILLQLHSAVMAAAFAATAWLMLYASKPWENRPLEALLVAGGLVLFMLWAVMPYAAASMLLSRSSWPGPSLGVLMTGHFVLASAALFIYQDAFFAHPDPQGAIVFIFVPIYQWVGGLLVWGLGFATAAITRKIRRNR